MSSSKPVAMRYKFALTDIECPCAKPSPAWALTFRASASNRRGYRAMSRQERKDSLAIRWPVLLALLSGAMSEPSHGQGKPTLIVLGEPSCPRCEVVLSHVLTLGALEGEGAVGPTAVIERDSRGNILLSHLYERHRLKVFAADGAFKRAIGRSGEGPGEFRSISEIVIGPRDTLYVFDARNRRMTTIEPNDYSAVQTEPFDVPPAPDGVRRLSGGNWIVHGVLQSPSTIGFPLHLVSADGRVLRSFGTDRPNVTPRTLYLRTARLVGAGGADSTWTLAWREYRVDLWVGEGQHAMTIRRSVEWFTPHLEPGVEREPWPAGAAIWQQGEQLWIAVRVAAADWRNAIDQDRRSEDGGIPLTVSNMEAVFDTMIDVIDLSSGRLIATARIEPAIVTVTSAGDLVSYHETNDGVPLLSIWRASLETRSRQ